MLRETAMTTFMISYDLATPAENKSAVTARIMAAGDAWARPLDQTWYVRAETDAAALEAMIADELGDDDGLLVQEVGADAVFANTGLRWFRRRPLPAEAAPATAEILSFPTPAPSAATPADPLAA